MGFAAVAQSCDLKEGVYADMHDGDEKVVSISDGAMTITSANQTQTWEVKTTFDCSTHKAMVDFDVPGKADHPPVPIQATLYTSFSAAAEKNTFVFTDTSGQLVEDATFPLNQWVQESAKTSRKFRCPAELSAVFQDMHDGDKKHVEIKGDEMIITPAGSDPNWGPVEWKVKAKFDHKSCSASVHFDVPGKADHPPVPLLATFWGEENTMAYAREIRETFEFTDPTGTLAKASMPLNRWIELPSSSVHV